MKIWLSLTILLFLILVDQGIKFLISTLDLTSKTWLGSIGVWHNSGAIFSVGLPNYVTLSLSLVAITGLLYGWYYYSYVRLLKSNLVPFGLMLLIAGGLSNIVDRLYIGAVRDFIAIDMLNLYMNLADVYIIFGSMMVISSFYGLGIRRKKV